METIEFTAEIHKVQTLVDGGLRITLNLSEGDILQAAHLMECKRVGVAGTVTFVPIVADDEAEAGWVNT